jgi:hypothetical protein
VAAPQRARYVLKALKEISTRFVSRAKTTEIFSVNIMLSRKRRLGATSKGFSLETFNPKSIFSVDRKAHKYSQLTRFKYFVFICRWKRAREVLLPKIQSMF